MGMTRRGVASSARSKSSSSTLVALRENRLKLTPPSTTVAPRGERRPTITEDVMPASLGMTVCAAGQRRGGLTARRPASGPGLFRFLRLLRLLDTDQCELRRALL